MSGRFQWDDFNFTYGGQRDRSVAVRCADFVTLDKLREILADVPADVPGDAIAAVWAHAVSFMWKDGAEAEERS